MTDKMHEKWLLGYRKDKGDEPRYKPIPNNPSEDQLKNFKGIKMIDGLAHQNINQPANNIVPALNHKLNGGPAVDYAEVVEKMPVKSIEDINNLASEFHDVWMKHNSWQKDSNPTLFQPYENLPRDEKLKDLVQLKVALDLHYKNDPAIQQLFDQAKRSTK